VPARTGGGWASGAVGEGERRGGGEGEMGMEA